MDQVELEHGAATDVGRVREVNEDAFLAAPPVFVVADGMGGYQGGDIASAVVVEEFRRLADAGYDPRRGAEVVEARLAACQERITAFISAQRAAGSPGYQAGTTAVVALLVADDEGPRWLLANLGDSRAYRWAQGRLDRVSVDHSLVQELVDAGQITAAQAAVHPQRHVVTRALGGDFAAADYFLLPVTAGERLLLCSDGVTEMLDDARVAEVLAGTAGAQAAADALVAAAVEEGGRDNATAVVVDVLGLLPPDEAAEPAPEGHGE